MFSDEIWAMGRGHTTSYVMVLDDGSENYLPECTQHKYSRAPTWMFYGTIINGHKGPACFWEKEWHNMNSALYDKHVLSMIQAYI